jgi:hypothetical protein
LFANLTEQKRSPRKFFNERIAALYGKAWSASFLRIFCSRRRAETRSEETQNPPPHVGGYNESWLCSEADARCNAVNSVSAALEAISAMPITQPSQNCFERVHWGRRAAMRMRLFEPELLDNQKRWITNVIESRPRSSGRTVAGTRGGFFGAVGDDSHRSETLRLHRADQ